MNRISFSIGSLFFLLAFCVSVPAIHAAEAVTLNDAVSLMPADYRHQLVQQLSLADENQQQWLDTLVKTPADQREGIAFLLANMPAHDLKELKGDFILHDMALAYEVRAKTPWAAAIPKEIFLNEVLPYANLNERREDWRSDFSARFLPLVAHCKSADEAAQILNREVFKAVNVSYHATKRLKPDQSPAESMKIHYASCSGLSFILVDACRAVGVPARVAGTALWTNGSGNHTWVEVWDGQWRFLGAAEPGEFNKTWFADLASKADDSKPENRIQAASFRQTSQPFLMVWDPQSTIYPAIDVTGYYVNRRVMNINVVGADGKPAEGTVRVEKEGRLIALASGSHVSFEFAGGTDYTVSVESKNQTSPTQKVQLPADHELTIDLKITGGGQK